MDLPEIRDLSKARHSCLGRRVEICKQKGCWKKIISTRADLLLISAFAAERKPGEKSMLVSGCHKCKIINITSVTVSS